MKRTITIKNFGSAYYRNEELGCPVGTLLKFFNLKDDKRYTITIVEGTHFKIYGVNSTIYIKECVNHLKELFVSGVCAYAFKKIFFNPDGKKRYDIIVEEK